MKVKDLLNKLIDGEEYKDLVIVYEDITFGKTLVDIEEIRIEKDKIKLIAEEPVIK